MELHEEEAAFSNRVNRSERTALHTTRLGMIGSLAVHLLLKWTPFCSFRKEAIRFYSTVCTNEITLVEGPELCKTSSRRTIDGGFSEGMTYLNQFRSNINVVKLVLLKKSSIRRINVSVSRENLYQNPSTVP
jgi:hypothetical protein